MESNPSEFRENRDQQKTEIYESSRTQEVVCFIDLKKHESHQSLEYKFKATRATLKVTKNFEWNRDEMKYGEKMDHDLSTGMEQAGTVQFGLNAINDGDDKSLKKGEKLKKKCIESSKSDFGKPSTGPSQFGLNKINEIEQKDESIKNDENNDSGNMVWVANNFSESELILNMAPSSTNSKEDEQTGANSPKSHDEAK